MPPVHEIRWCLRARGYKSNWHTDSLKRPRELSSRIARKLTGKKRNRVFAYDRYLAILNQGTEPS